jgi:hypothetical protein
MLKFARRVRPGTPLFIVDVASKLFGIVYPGLPYDVSSNSQDGAIFD